MSLSRSRELILALLFLLAQASYALRANMAAANLLGDYADAKCLDGSTALYYFRNGWGDGSTKFHFHQMGGGFCGSVASCYNRAQDCQQGLGSSKCWPSEYNLTTAGTYFSSSAVDNPLLWNWNHVYMVYCDGGYFSGANASVTSFNGTDLHFAGQHILRAVVADAAARHGLGNASDVLIGGCSAGGIATFAHLDMMADLVQRTGKSKMRIAGFADSGYYMDVDFYTNQKRFVTEHQVFNRSTRAGGEREGETDRERQRHREKTQHNELSGERRSNVPRTAGTHVNRTQ